MANEPSLYERWRGKRTKDIRLPSEGKRDPRIPFSALDQLHKAFKTGKVIMSEKDPVEGLKKAGRGKY